MTTRKPKPTFPSMIESPAERLRLITVTVDQKTPARGGGTGDGQGLRASRSPPSRGKVTLH